MVLYDSLASWWTLLSHPDDYVEEAHDYTALLHEAGEGRVREVLELGSGGGNNASHMKAAFRMTLVEPSAGMRAQSMALNPDCQHIDGDMRTVRLGRTFHAVFVHDAICYMATEADLAAALETASAHLEPGGVALLLPDYTRESYRPSDHVGGGDGPDGRSLRYLEWHMPVAPDATTYETHYALLLREADGSVRSVHDRHMGGLFSRATWLRLMGAVGLRGRLFERDYDGQLWDGFVAMKE